MTITHEVAPPAPPVPTDAGPDRETGGDEDGVHLYASVTVFGRHHGVELYFPEKPDDATLADELWAAVSAVAAMQGSGVLMELQRRCADLRLT